MRVFVLKLNFAHVLVAVVALLLIFSVYHETVLPAISHVISVASNRLVPIYAVNTEAKKLPSRLMRLGEPT